MRFNDSIPLSNLPEDGLRFFHGLTNWVQQTKCNKLNTIKWGKGHKALFKLHCIKLTKGDSIPDVTNIGSDTLYVPNYSSGLFVLRQIRNAFCHDDIEYDNTTGQYQIALTSEVKISGRFSLESIKEFAAIFLPNQK